MFRREAFNSQNDRIWAKEAPATEDRLVDHTQKHKSVIVWAAVSSRGKSPLVFVEEGVKIDRYVYIAMLREHLLPWANDLFDGKEWCFQQDTVPAHKANETQEFLSEECPDFITKAEWPPYSPDLNPMDYLVWSILEAKACAKPHKTIESLKRALLKAWDEIPLETLVKIVDNFPKRLQACVEAEGGYFE
uniref:Tc1-like transposase DDE domain-containing protein n=1 Tax=Acrobeloides nanus TaxID=290746 RepID=A0A914EB77_9BILA